MQCNKEKCIFYNENFEDNCEKRIDLTGECIKADHKDYIEELDHIRKRNWF